MLRAMFDEGYSKEKVLEMGALLLKIGSLFRAGKTTTGCNMEGFGAGAAAMAAAFTELGCGTPRQMERAMVLAISPTLGNPCTPRVMVPGLCATHIGGAVVVGNLAAALALKTNIEVNVPVDVMLALAASIHPLSAEALVPEVTRFMDPFFKRKSGVEALIDQNIRAKEDEQKVLTLAEAAEIAKNLANQARPITETLGEAVVGGSSQAVGSPTNAARIAHYLKSGEIKKVKIELYPELFARRGINVPGILMGAVFGAPTSDYQSYNQVLEKVRDMGIEVEIVETEEHQVQRITLDTDQVGSQVDSLNRGGGRLVLRSAHPDFERAVRIAEDLGLTLVNK
jgi:L-serine dehydratase